MRKCVSMENDQPKLKIPIDHRRGQYRAELFERLVWHLLFAVYAGSTVKRQYILPRDPEHGGLSYSVDFLVSSEQGECTVVETKAPYTDTASFGVNKTFRYLKDVFTRLKSTVNVKRIVVAIASELPAASAKEFSEASSFFASAGIETVLWDAKVLSHLCGRYLRLTIHSFSLENLQDAIGKLEPGLRGSAEVQPEASLVATAGSESLLQLPTGEHDGVIALCADFCSYSKFVHASGGDRELILSIMSRFYRETRTIVEECGGKLDKFMGDGLLAFWLPTKGSNDTARCLNECIARLIGGALEVAEEWQEQIDMAVEPRGMRAGAAVGPVLFIPESASGTTPLHAIGECINIAARLQSHSKPNEVLISNRLHNEYFTEDARFDQVPPLELKNIGSVVAWRKSFES